eukprot:CAMPEP_0175891964 /NCGR_PEP_ID=MMETSP0107_2-20121207/48657_1 /TAXON_ID=195067 ORGANISM="Goniomonas pacifica, Strain CCMP1869" /NCGR_SAMPLE_ID=MMETSP0107_2 /ASSEMBLY_ACC=CAM_ASM_000203 /LENGTH=90 /DNA_ID=CAMNT_0017212861 /DNA_START=794 /DNA_END=1067 /DNA_ORIENTATION=+
MKAALRNDSETAWGITGATNEQNAATNELARGDEDCQPRQQDLRVIFIVHQHQSTPSGSTSLSSSSEGLNSLTTGDCGHGASDIHSHAGF